MKDTLIEMKNPQGTNSEGKEAKVQINNLEQKKEYKHSTRKKEETTILKNEERLNKLWSNFKPTNTQIIGVPIRRESEKRKSKKLKTYLKNNERKLP